MTFFFPAWTVYGNTKSQNIEKLAAIHSAQHSWTAMLTYKIKFSFLEYLTPRYTILGVEENKTEDKRE